MKERKRYRLDKKVEKLEGLGWIIGEKRRLRMDKKGEKRSFKMDSKGEKRSFKMDNEGENKSFRMDNKERREV